MKRDAIESSILEFLSGFDESRFPASFLTDFEALECLGANTWNETLLVRDKRTGEKAIAKCYDAKNAKTNGEGEVLKRLSHPGLPVYIAEYRNDETVCVVRSYIAGETLASVAARERFSKGQVISLGIALCDVLAYLHSQTPPIIHRDIKPENIVLKADGSPALIDFGISRIYDKHATKDTVHFGTALFAPPEQYGFSQTDCRSDLFSLGMVLYFLLTGATDRAGEDAIPIPDRALDKIIRRATAFSPKDRYASAHELRRALKMQRPGRKRLHALLLVCAASAAVGLGITGAAHLQQSAFKIAPMATAEPAAASAVTFSEPLFEQAVRTVLGKGETDVILPEELRAIEALYVFGTQVSGDADAFYASADAWYASQSQAHGSIQSLSDVSLLPNLRTLCLAAQRIDDIRALSALPLLEKVEFKHNQIADISVLAELPRLSSVGLNSNPVTDLSPLASCKQLKFLDLCDVRGYDPAFLDTLGDFEFLDIANSDDAFLHLGARRIRQLKIGRCAFSSLSHLAGVTGLASLEVKYTALTSLAGVERHAGLTYLNIAGCDIDDLTPVLSLPLLDTLVLSPDMEPLLSQLGTYSFSVTYE